MTETSEAAEPESRDSEDHWVLAAMIAPAEEGGSTSVTEVRALEPAETEKARAANALIGRLSGAASYQRLVELFQQLAAAGSKGASPARLAKNMNSAVMALARAGASYEEELLQPALADFAEEADTLERLRSDVGLERAHPPFQLLLGIAELPEGPFSASEEGVVLSAEAIEILRVRVPECTENTNVIATLTSALLLAQRMLALLLSAYSDRIDEASLTIRLLAAEVLEGGPVLLRVAKADEADAGKLQMTPEPLNLDNAALLVHARRQATLLLATTTTDQPSARAAEQSQGPSAESPAAQGETFAAADPEFVDAPSPAPREQATLKPEATADGVEGAAAAQVLDLEALAEYVTRLPELERVWSEGLDQAELAQAHEDMEAKFRSLLSVLQRQASARDSELAAAGKEVLIPAYPLPDEDLANLTFAPDPEQRLRQLQIAQVEALMLLLQAIEGMRRPSMRRLTFSQEGSGSLETWWASGGFAFLRQRLKLVSTLSNEVDAVAKSRIDERSGPTPDPGGDVFDRLKLAEDALLRGDPDACLVHSALALRARAELEAEVPDDLLERLSANARLGSQGILLARLAEAVQSLAAGHPLDLGAAHTIAPRVLQLVGQLCLDSPQLIVDAVTDSADDD